MKSRRVGWIDLLKGYGIILVFLGHTTLINQYIDHYIFSFHMPLFFFLAGFFYKDSSTIKFRDFVLEKTNTRLIPYFTFGALTYCIWLLPILLRKFEIYEGLTSIPESLFVKPLLGMFYGVGDSNWLPHNGLLWFLACLFITEIIFFFVKKISGANLSIFLLCLLGCGVLGYIDSLYFPTRPPFGVDIALTAVVFYGFGSLLKKHLLKIDVGLAIAFLCISLGGILAFANNRVDMNFNKYGNFFLFYISSALSILGYIILFKRMPMNRFMSYVGSNSLVFYLLQNVGFFLINILLFLLLKIRIHEISPNLIYAFIYVILAILVIFPFVFLIKKKVPIMIHGFSK